MPCGGSCSSCGEVDPGRATGMAKRAFDGFKPRLEHHDTSDSPYHQRTPLSVPLGATPGPRSSTALRGPPATFKGRVGRFPISEAPEHTNKTLWYCKDHR